MAIPATVGVSKTTFWLFISEESSNAKASLNITVLKEMREGCNIQTLLFHAPLNPHTEPLDLNNATLCQQKPLLHVREDANQVT